MSLNLIRDPWIPVIRRGAPDVIRPDQIAETGVERLDWPRPDLNLGCLELLIGLVHIAEPPADAGDRARRTPDPERLRAALAPFAAAFDIDGDGPRFLQDRADLEGDPNGPDMLFIDSAGGQTTRNNADLMVRRERYPALSLPLAAMALYTMQAFAPSGGAGNRTSMRGGGPMVTLVRPREETATPLWSLIWANAPRGRPLDPAAIAEALPWMRPTLTSEKGGMVQPPDIDGVPHECLFGMPRRLQLVFGDGRCAITGEEGPVVTGVVQRPYGTNYGQWAHPLTPYYCQKVGGEWFAKHPRPGVFGYRGWRGVLLAGEGGATVRLAQTVRRFQQERHGETATVLVAGWAMDNMKPLDFVWSEQPLFPLSAEAEDAAVALVEAAEQAGYALAASLRAALGAEGLDKGLVAREREAFFERTQAPFERLVGRLAAGAELAELAGLWTRDLAAVALDIFDAHAVPGLADRDRDAIPRIVAARRGLRGAFAGRPPYGKGIFTPLDLPLPAKRERKETAA